MTTAKFKLTYPSYCIWAYTDATLELKEAQSAFQAAGMTSPEVSTRLMHFAQP